MLKNNASARSVNSTRNAVFSLFCSFIALLASFVGRTVFVHYLAAEVLGLNGLFANLLTFLSLTELGIGSAINFALYRPLKEGDTEKVKSLMAVYKRFYILVGSAILTLGALLTPFLPILIKDLPQSVPLADIRVYYLLYVVNSAVSYFFTYKRSLIICDQREFISSLSIGVFRIVTVALQVLLLVTTGSFLWYLLAQIGCTLAENVTVSCIADRLYPFLREKGAKKLAREEDLTLRRNISALCFHKIGGAVVFSSDHIIISKFVGLVQTGLYSNYTLILSSVNTVLSQALTGMAASLGNLMAGSPDAYSEKILYHILFLNSWVYGFASACILGLCQPFIRLWVGQGYLLGDLTLILAVVSFYLTGMRRTVWLFKDAAGVFTQDRFKPLIEAAVNIAVSIPLAIRLGIPGVLTGTIFSTLSVSFWYEAQALFRARFGKGAGRYLLMQAKYLAFNAIVAALCFFLCSLVGSYSPGAFFLRLAICLAVPNLACLPCFRRSTDMAYFKLAFSSLFKKLLPRRKQKDKG